MTKSNTNEIKMWSIVEYLKKPELVVAVQEWFGIEYLDKDEQKQNKSDQSTYDCSGMTSEFDKNQYSNCSEYKVHRRKESDESCDKNVPDSETNYINGNLSENQNSTRNFRINNKFWYYLFVFGTELGDETFYSILIPFWFWNVDGCVGRRVVFVWSLVMYIGQMLKDIIRWPRPGPPVQRLQNKWSIEYGMPSTHAMVRSKLFSPPQSSVCFNRCVYS